MAVRRERGALGSVHTGGGGSLQRPGLAGLSRKLLARGQGLSPQLPPFP